jgi:undecaprenyl-diphosphatase
MLAREVKHYVERARPAQLLANVHVRGNVPPALAYVSGHCAVAVCLAVVSTPWLHRRGRAVVWTLAGIVCFGRVYVGAHFPLDVLGGASVGAASGGAALLVVNSIGRNRGHGSPAAD